MRVCPPQRSTNLTLGVPMHSPSVSSVSWSAFLSLESLVYGMNTGLSMTLTLVEVVCWVPFPGAWTFHCWLLLDLLLLFCLFPGGTGPGWSFSWDTLLPPLVGLNHILVVRPFILLWGSISAMDL